jgi:SpoVK/Ycf46/Vps4 family AAA+-type ATPase
MAVFLQSLEYYQGTLFLTTNRAEAFDEAFESRVHISVNYTELSATSRKEVWKTFLTPSTLHSPSYSSNPSPKSSKEKSVITDEEINEFVQMEINGRQIKNVVKSASLLALSEKGPLRAEHIRTVLRIKKAERVGR